MRPSWFRQLPAVSLIALMAAATAACGQSANESSRPTGDERIDVVASFYPLAQVVERVGGDRVRVENLTPSGVEPHDLELTPAQVDSIDDADFVVFLGGGFQPAVEKAVKRRGPAATDVSEGVGLVSGAAEALKAEEGGGDQAGEVADGQAAAADPHFWLDPQLLAKTISQVQDALTKAKPADSDEFRANGAAMADELAALDLRFREGLANCVRREVVTAHAAFYYLTARYGLTQRPITGLSPESEPDPGRLAELTDLIKSRGITTVFYEELVPRDLADTLAREAGAKTAILSPLEGLSVEEREAGLDYFGVMGDNLDALRVALDCA